MQPSSPINNNVAVLLLIFNRPDLTFKVFESIRMAKPTRLFIAADGPRNDRLGEDLLCEQARSVAKSVDWDCSVQTLFRPENLGCKNGVSQAINWFFGHVEEGIILEDDCLPELTFFQFCDELLQRYRHDERVGMISGDNFQDGVNGTDESYYFSVFHHIWGWATWRDRWADYQRDLEDWPRFRGGGHLRRWLGSRAAVTRWTAIFDSCASGEIDTWDYQWVFANWKRGRLSILPTSNLVTNIGFDGRATHTRDFDGAMAELATFPIKFPLSHPRGVKVNRAADRRSEARFFQVPDSENRIVSRLKRVFERCKQRF